MEFSGIEGMIKYEVRGEHIHCTGQEEDKQVNFHNQCPGGSIPSTKIEKWDTFQTQNNSNLNAFYSSLLPSI